jgi:hypothetical protein
VTIKEVGRIRRFLPVNSPFIVIPPICFRIEQKRVEVNRRGIGETDGKRTSFFAKSVAS